MVLLLKTHTTIVTIVTIVTSTGRHHQESGGLPPQSPVRLSSTLFTAKSVIHWFSSKASGQAPGGETQRSQWIRLKIAHYCNEKYWLDENYQYKSYIGDRVGFMIPEPVEFLTCSSTSRLSTSNGVPKPTGFRGDQPLFHHQTVMSHQPEKNS